MLQRIFDASKSLRDQSILVTLVPVMDPSEFQIPSSVAVEKFVPHSAVLPQASAMVCQYGIGVVTKALINGVPLLCIPILGDQPDNAARVAARGAGLRIARDASVEVIRDAMQRLVNESNYRLSAKTLEAKLNNNDPVENAVKEIEKQCSTAL